MLITLQLNPTKNDFEKINTSIIFSTIIELINKKIEKKELEKIVLIEVPDQVYSELRKVFVALFESSGFKEIKISEKIDFEKLYNIKKTQ